MSEVKVAKTETVERYRIDVDGLFIDAEIIDRSKITLYNKERKLDFTFLDSDPVVVEAIGRAIVEAAQILTAIKHDATL